MTESRVGLIGVGLLGSCWPSGCQVQGLRSVAMTATGPTTTLRTRTSEQPRATVVKMSSANQLAEGHDTIVMCLPDSQVVKTVVEELADNLRAGTLLIDATTGDPAMAEEIAEHLAERQIGYVDATIAGSSEQARRGEAVVVIGGSEADVARATPILESWSSRRFHVGAAGSGQRLKLVINLVLGLNRAVLAEGLNLARAAGVDPAAALEVLKATPAYSTGDGD